MDITEYTETFNRLSKILGPTTARQLVDEMDADRIKANKKEAKALAETERIRAIVRQELGL